MKSKQLLFFLTFILISNSIFAIQEKPSANELLFDGVRHQSIKEIKKALKLGADINSADSNLDTPLHRAAFRNNVKIMKFLLKNGANIEARGQLGYTPLGFAAKARRFDAVKLLIEKGANVNSPARDGSTPIFGPSVALPYINEEDKKSQQDNDVKIIKILLNVGADPNIKTKKSGFTPLHMAAMFDHTRAIEALLENPKIKILKDENGETPLQTAIRLNKKEAIKTLIKHLKSLTKNN